MKRKQIKRIANLVIFVIVFLGISSLALAGGGVVSDDNSTGGTDSSMSQNQEGTQDERMITGTVASVADDRNSLRLNIDSREITVNMDQNTAIMDENMNRIGAENINQDDRISVTGNVAATDESGLVTEMNAREISKMSEQQ